MAIDPEAIGHRQMVHRVATVTLGHLARVYNEKRLDPSADPTLLSPEKAFLASSPYLEFLDLRPGCLLPANSFLPDDGK